MKRTRMVDALLMMQEDCCYVCKIELDRDTDAFDVDHKQRLADGGSDDIKNKCVVCIPCHRRKTRRENTMQARDPSHDEPASANALIQNAQLTGPKQIAQRYSIAQLRSWFVDGKLKNAECNRHPVWDEGKQREFVLTLIKGGVTPPIFVNKLRKEDERHVYDGGNRLHTIMEFMDGNLHVHVRHGKSTLKACYGRCKSSVPHKCEALNRDNVRRFESIMIDVFEWDNLTTNEATEIAVHLNEGTPMCIGEKLKLMTGRDTPRAKMLKYLYESDDFQQLVTRERDRDLKTLALFLRSVISPDLVYSSALTSNLGPLQNFYANTEPVDERDWQRAEAVLRDTRRLLDGRTKSQRKLLICLIGMQNPRVDVERALNDSDETLSVEALLQQHST